MNTSPVKSSDPACVSRPLKLREVDSITYGNSVGTGTTAQVSKVDLQTIGVMGSAVAKIFNTEFVRNERLRERTIEEITVHSQLKHKNIVEFFGRYISPDRIELFLKYIPSTFYKQLCIPEAEPACSLEKKLGIFLDICEGLIYLHDKNYVHLDLNSTNVLLDENGTPKLSDFGQTALTGTYITKHDACFYMAPELSRSSSNPTDQGIKVCETMDYFSLAVLALSALAQLPINDVWINQDRYQEMLHLNESRLKPFQFLIITAFKKHFQSWWPALPGDKKYRPLIIEKLSLEEFLQYLHVTDENNKEVVFSLLRETIIPCLDRSPDKRPRINNIKLTLKKLRSQTIPLEGTPV